MNQGQESFLSKLWRWVKVVFVVFVLLFVAGVIWRMPIVAEQDRSAKVAQEIRDSHITMADVDGSNLPPEPDPNLVDATVEGIDANGNGIRDDVELAIFKKYPGDANLKIRAAELQYAHALQFYLTSVFSVETLTATSWQKSRAFFCLNDSVSGKPRPGASDAEWRIYDQKFKAATVFLENTVLNNTLRVNKYSEVFDRFMSSHGSPSGGYCDLESL